MEKNKKLQDPKNINIADILAEIQKVKDRFFEKKSVSSLDDLVR